MWNKYFRTCIFNIIYQIIFNYKVNQLDGNSYDYTDYSINWSYMLDAVDESFDNIPANNNESIENNFREGFDTEFAESVIKYFLQNQEKLKLVIQPHLSEWNKTFDLIKSILYCFLLEKHFAKDKEKFIEQSVGLYIKLTEEFSHKNIKLVHAVLSKIVE